MREAESRRIFLQRAAVAGAAALAGCASGEKHDEKKDDDVTPAEDLMREHGALNRILLIYDESASRLEKREEVPLDKLADAAGIIERFIEGYHEKLEEEHIFPRFEKAKKHEALVSVLRQQHKAGRTCTSLIIAGCKPGAAARETLAAQLRAFVRMYRPHEAREDTVLFPDLRGLMSAKEYDELGDAFEKREHELLGADGFEGVVARVAELEKAFGLDDLAKFTPPA